MRRIVLWLAATVTVVVLLFGYHTSTNSPGTAGAGTSTAPPTGASTPAASGPPTGSSTPTPTGGGSSTASPKTTKTYTGAVAQTRWGPVQVAITVSGGTITKVDVPQFPSGNGRDQQINAYALPVLVKETLAAQSANIDAVSGATVTSGGYLQSLQSALDQAGK